MQSWEFSYVIRMKSLDFKDNTMEKSKRLLALDVLRGMTIAGMVLVNNPGSWKNIYAPLRHAQWNGLTPTDLVFPFFLFMMGVSMYISLRKFEFRLSRDLLAKIFRRTAVIFFIGLAIHAFADLLWGWNGWDGVLPTLKNVRIMGVLQRLALAYCFASLIVTVCRYRVLPWIIGGLLGSYALILFLGNGFVYGPENILTVFDRAIIGASNMYNDNGIEPEGILGTIPSVAHVLIGFCVGKVCLEKMEMKDKLVRLFTWGTQLALAGWLLSYACPLNKKVWSPTFVLLTCGLACVLLALLIYFIDMKKTFRFTLPFEVYGVNPLFCYVLSQVLAIFLGYSFGTSTSAHRLFYEQVLCRVFGDSGFSSLLYSLSVVMIVWLFGLYLYRKKIYIKI